MAITITELENILLVNFPQAKIKIIDLVGDQDHYSLHISDQSFVGKTVIAQHKMVNEALSEVLKSRLHAITIKTTSN